MIDGRNMGFCPKDDLIQQLSVAHNGWFRCSSPPDLRVIFVSLPQTSSGVMHIIVLRTISDTIIAKMIEKIDSSRFYLLMWVTSLITYKRHKNYDSRHSPSEVSKRNDIKARSIG